MITINLCDLSQNAPPLFRQVCEVGCVHVKDIQCVLYINTVRRMIPPDFPASPDPPTASYQIATSRSPSNAKLHAIGS